jgi:polyvinyl alcohol dehydrogenase (cytochrome)
MRPRLRPLVFPGAGRNPQRPDDRGRKAWSTQYAAFFGDIHGNIYSVDTANGELLWKVPIDPHPLSRITAGIKVYNGRLYVPVASLEEPESSSFNYPAVTFRGMVAALDAATGKQIWKTYTIDETPTKRKSAAGKEFLGPAGGGVWGPVAIDRNAGPFTFPPAMLFPSRRLAAPMPSWASTWTQARFSGSNRMNQATCGTPAVRRVHLRLDSRRGRRAGGPARAGAAAAAAVVDGGGGGGRAQMPDSYYCPDAKENPDWDFSAGVMVLNMPNGKTLLIAGQKSGMVWAHDPDQKGALVWKSDISRGQIVFGGAADNDTAYFAMRGGTVAAVRISDGIEKWATYVPPQESMNTHAGFTAALP